MDFLSVGDRVFGSTLGPGVVTGVGLDGFPYVNGRSSVFVIRDDGAVFDPLRVYAPGGVKGDLYPAVRRVPRTVGGRWRPLPAAAAAAVLLGVAYPLGAAGGAAGGAVGSASGGPAGGAAGTASGETSPSESTTASGEQP